ncbi:MAG: hypothetical protein E6K94_03135 [Thaumarchaeota archaeon]|nr:MAG: hypothetical protein E6K94_03135 [Nitrososphaerota archaeon]
MTEQVSNQIVVATVEGRPYYKIVSMLKSMNISFSSLSPEEASRTNAKIIITTKNEASLIRRKNLIYDFQLDTFPPLFKAKLLKNLSGNYLDDVLVVGVDPGNRIGICVMYLHTELYSTVRSSIREAVKFIMNILSRINSGKKILKIGNGDLIICNRIAQEIKNLYGSVRIEIVNEFGTSRNILPNCRGIRDIWSARSIALRPGRIF